jgi:hypothetical protein
LFGKNVKNMVDLDVGEHGLLLEFENGGLI